MAALPLAAVPARSNVLLDANVLVYALTSPGCQSEQLVRRCQIEQVSGFTTVEVVNEVCHRLMVAEAFRNGFIAKPNAGALKGRKAIISRLSEYWIQIERLLTSNILVLDLDEKRLRSAQRLRSAHGLLTTDATIIAGAMWLGITEVASNDKDFDGIPSITIYSPNDVP
jgi:predicted nucleic acid-binding protein